MQNLRNDTNELTIQKQAHRLKSTFMVAGAGLGRGWGGGRGGIVREFGMDMYILLYFKWITNKGPLYSTENSAQCYMVTRMGEEFGGEWIHEYAWLSPFAVHLKLSQHC